MDPTQVSLPELASVFLNGSVVGLFVVKFLRVAQGYRGRSIDLYQLLTSFVLLAAALGLAIAGWAVRFAPPDAGMTILRVDLAATRLVLVAWLLFCWRRRP
jgi:hypothetical protein